MFTIFNRKDKFLSAILVILVISSLAFGLVSCKKKSKVEPLVVGMELQYPPFEMSDENGNAMGVSVDIANKFGEFLDRPVEIKAISWTGLIPSLKTGKIDVIISSISATPERKKSVDFSIPYVRNSLALLVQKNSKIKKFSDLDDSSVIVVKTGTLGDIFARKNLDFGKIRQFDSLNACVMEIAQGRADAFIYDPLTLFKNYQKHEDTTKLILDVIPGTENFSAMAFSKNNTELLEKANEFILQAQEEGFFNELGDKYLVDIKKLYEEENIPFFFDMK